MAPHCSTLAWRIPRTKEPGGLQSMGSLWVRCDWATSLHFSLSCTEEGNGNPLQCSCLENPRDGGAEWAAVYGVAQSRTRLKRLSSSSSRYCLSEQAQNLYNQSLKNNWLQVNFKTHPLLPGSITTTWNEITTAYIYIYLIYLFLQHAESLEQEVRVTGSF